MTKDFSCRTCGHLRTSKWHGMAETGYAYYCDGMADEIDLNNEITPIDSHFCALHTDRETVKLQASHDKLLDIVKGFLQWWDSPVIVNGGHIDRLRAAIAKAEHSEDEPITDDEGDE